MCVKNTEGYVVSCLKQIHYHHSGLVTRLLWLRAQIKLISIQNINSLQKRLSQHVLNVCVGVWNAMLQSKAFNLKN